MAKEFKEMVDALTKEQLATPATLEDVVEALKSVDELTEAAVRLNFQLEEQRKFTNIALVAMIDYLGLYVKALAEKTNYTFNENQYFNDFVTYLDKRLEPYSKMVEEHQNVLKNL